MSSFSEIQKAFRLWLLVLMAVIWGVFICFSVLAVNQQIINGIPFGDKPMSDTILIIFIVLINLIFMFLDLIIVILKLEISIDKYGISYSYFPFIGKRTITKDEIRYAWVRKYKPVKEYGGWGIRSVFRNKAYNCWGQWGIQIITTESRCILLGTHKPEEAKTVLETLGYNKEPRKE